MDSEGELNQEKYKQFKKRKMEQLPEVDHSQKNYERVKTV